MPNKNQLIFYIKSTVMECYKIQDILKNIAFYDLKQIYYLVNKTINKIIDVRKIIATHLENNTTSTCLIIVHNDNILKENYQKLMLIINVFNNYYGKI